MATNTQKSTGTVKELSKDVDTLQSQIESLNERLATLEKYFAEGLIFQKLRQLEDQIRRVEDQAVDLTQKGEKAIGGLRRGFQKAWGDIRKGQKQAVDAMTTETNTTEH